MVKLKYLVVGLNFNQLLAIEFSRGTNLLNDNGTLNFFLVSLLTKISMSEVVKSVALEKLQFFGSSVNSSIPNYNSVEFT